MGLQGVGHNWVTWTFSPASLHWSLEAEPVGAVGMPAGPWQPLQHKWDEMGSARNCCSCVVSKLCLTLLRPIDYSLPGSSVHGISQARILEWVAISFSRGSSQPRDQIPVSCIGRLIIYQGATREAPTYWPPKQMDYRPSISTGMPRLIKLK